MNIYEYQIAAARTIGMYETIDEQMINGALGLTGEAGEVADYLKKCIFQGHELDRNKIAEELGDIMWYIALTSDAIGIDMESIAAKNINKLMRRYPTGFKAEDSINRVE